MFTEHSEYAQHPDHCVVGALCTCSESLMTADSGASSDAAGMLISWRNRERVMQLAKVQSDLSPQAFCYCLLA